MAGLFGHLAKRASSGVPSYGMIPPLGSVQSASGLLISQATAMSIPTVMACVRRRAADVARCTPSLYRKAPDGSRVPVTDHPVAEILKRPNEQQNWFEFCEQMMIGYLLRQNAYAPIIRDRRNVPVELIPVNPDAVMTLEATTGEIFYNVNRIGLWQIAMLRDFPTAIPEDDIFHLRGMTFNALVGASTIGLGRDALGLAMGLEQQAVRWMAAGARPSGILTSNKLLGEDAAKRLKAQWDELNAGLINLGRTAVLEDGVEWKQLQMTGVDLQFLPQREFSVLEICRLFGVPPHKVFVTDRAASMNIPQQDQDYFNSTVSPDLVRWEEKIRQVFRLDLDVEAGDDGIFVHMDETELLRADILTRANALRLAILSGWMTQNEARATEHFPRHADGDVLLVPANTASIGSDASGTAADGAGRPPAGQAPAPGASTNGTQPGTENDRAGLPVLLPRAA